MQIDKKVCGIFERWKPKSQFAEAQLLKSTVSFKMYHFCSQYVTSSRHVFQHNKTAKALSAMLNIYSISFKASQEATTGRQDQKSDNFQYYDTLGHWVSAATSGWAGWALAHPEFGSSVNPITTRGGRLCPPNNTCTPGFSDLPTTLQSELFRTNLVGTGLILSWPITSGISNLTESGKKIMF